MYIVYTLVTELLKLNLFEGQWLLYVPPGLPFTDYTFCQMSACVCFVSISEQTASFALYVIRCVLKPGRSFAEGFWVLFCCVYCAVRTEYLYIIVNISGKG